MLRSVLRACGRSGVGSSGRRCFSTSRFLLAVETFNLTDIGEGIVEVELKNWSVAEGDRVEQYDIMCEVQSDKATAEIPSPWTGVIKKLYYGEGETAFVHKPLVDIDREGDDGEEVEQPAQESASSEPEPTPSTPTPQEEPVASSPASSSSAAGSTLDAAALAELNKNVPMAPAARLLVREHKLDASMITATGKGGRVTKEDIMKYLASGGAAAQTTSAPATGVAVAGVEPAKQWSLEGDRTVDIKGVSKAMVRSMTQSLSIPSFSLGDEYELDALVALRNRLKDHLQAQAKATGEDPIKLTFLPFFIKACSVAMHQFPQINASINAAATQITYHGEHNIGVAMDTKDGLIVPNIKNCERKSILEIAAELSDLSARGRANKIGPDDFKKGTFAISNIGTLGATYVSPVINPPNVAIMAMGKLQKVPAFTPEGGLTSLTKMAVTYTADHRVIDGATMARYSNAVLSYLKNPDLFLLNSK